RPSALDLSSVAGDVQPPLPSAVAQSLQSARFISEPNSTTYPEGIQSPRPELNASAPAGKFRYDRDFLLQFMEVCKEKPESLPPLESIGLE
ncbi:eukaryotic translation initiation factor 4G1-domain-containing protein, partial [Mrakia frigida]|uniref:eukaryotic translation initiation factor 4G1-domain-containing protein n=1 Tax=Mrakia frigida TaxID=29902 RepID=UPI003FCC0DC3